MVRISICRPGSPFLAAVEKRDVGAMEIVANVLDMKLRGGYLASHFRYVLTFYDDPSYGYGNYSQMWWKLKRDSEGKCRKLRMTILFAPSCSCVLLVNKINIVKDVTFRI